MLLRLQGERSYSIRNEVEAMSSRYTSEELDELEDRGELYVCPSCDTHMHVDDVGQTCPECFISLDDLRGES